MNTSMAIQYLVGAGIVTMAAMFVLVIYGNALSTREDDELYLNHAEQVMMASEQQTLIGRMDRLARVIFALAMVSAVLFFSGAAIWVWVGLRG